MSSDSMKKERWEELALGIACPFCAPRSDENDFWAKVASLAVSTLYLDKIQTYRGYTVLIFDPRHATRPNQVSADEWQAWCQDLYLAQRAIERRAIEAMNWGMPAVNYDLMFQAMARAGGAMTRFSIGRNFSTAKTSF